MSYRDIAKARAVGDLKALNEASLGRVYQHVKKAAHQSLGIISGWRGENSGKENKEANKKLMSSIRSLGLGAFKLVGWWKECPEGKKDCEDSERVLTRERSFGIVGISKADLVKLTKKFKQEASVFLGPETDGKAVVIEPGKPDFTIGKFVPSKVADVYSRVRGRPFVFEGFDLPPGTVAEALIDKHVREGWHSSDERVDESHGNV